MKNPLNHDSNRLFMASMGWHVHYKVNGRVRVQLACDREAST